MTFAVSRLRDKRVAEAQTRTFCDPSVTTDSRKSANLQGCSEPVWALQALGAILIKIRAIEVDDLPAAQRADVALPLQLVDDPDSLAADLAWRERTWLQRHEYFADPTDPHWDGFEADDPERAALAYRRLLG